MIRWLSRYVKQITIFGVGIELRELPADEVQALPPIPPPSPRPLSPTPIPDSPVEPGEVVRQQDYICVSGTSASSQRTPRELDLTAVGDEIQFHVHQPGGSQRKLWVSRGGLQEALDRWQPTEDNLEIAVPAGFARSEAQVVFVTDASAEVEVQAGWWIWVSRDDLKTALAGVGVRALW